MIVTKQALTVIVVDSVLRDFRPEAVNDHVDWNTEDTVTRFLDTYNSSVIHVRYKFRYGVKNGHEPTAWTEAAIETALPTGAGAATIPPAGPPRPRPRSPHPPRPPVLPVPADDTEGGAPLRAPPLEGLVPADDTEGGPPRPIPPLEGLDGGAPPPGPPPRSSPRPLLRPLPRSVIEEAVFYCTLTTIGNIDCNLV